MILANRAAAETPAQRARAVLDAQVASVVAQTDAMQKMFDPKSVVLGAPGGAGSRP